jgi:hypothetical protein
VGAAVEHQPADDRDVLRRAEEARVARYAAEVVADVVVDRAAEQASG